MLKQWKQRKVGPFTAILIGLTALFVTTGLGLVIVGALNFFAPEPAPSTGAERIGPVPQEPEAATPDAAAPKQLSIASIGFTAPIESMSVGTEHDLFPPDFTQAFWLDDYGSPGAGSDNTVYLIGHTSSNASAVFDPLVNRVEQRSTVLVGDEIVVTTEKGDVVYEVTASERHPRSSLGTLEKVWQSKPDRLVLVTCLFEADQNIVSDNIVLFATERNALTKDKNSPSSSMPRVE
ncbi:class F sortase [Leucobacter chinensis]|uniref:class F sortase n=1 Tax=Leucobacter chinensis TaxID=2851010 RepID=UPI001C24EF65|nr:class F sortase [Leucobacter chinensis]